jgi:hypothetical protein
MTTPLLRRAAIALLAATAGPALAGIITFSGALGDASNAALVASDMGAAQFSDGFAAGGTDPYFTLFRGLTSATATFVASNYDHAVAEGGDFTQTEALSAGDYTVAIGTYTNLSFAENLGSGFLAEGFIGLGDSRYFGDGSYVLTVTLPDAQTVPEPAGTTLTLTAALAAMGASLARRRRKS